MIAIIAQSFKQPAFKNELSNDTLGALREFLLGAGVKLATEVPNGIGNHLTFCLSTYLYISTFLGDYSKALLTGTLYYITSKIFFCRKFLFFFISTCRGVTQVKLIPYQAYQPCYLRLNIRSFICFARWGRCWIRLAETFVNVWIDFSYSFLLLLCKTFSLQWIRIVFGPGLWDRLKIEFFSQNIFVEIIYKLFRILVTANLLEDRVQNIASVDRFNGGSLWDFFSDAMFDDKFDLRRIIYPVFMAHFDKEKLYQVAQAVQILFSLENCTRSLLFRS